MIKKIEIIKSQVIVHRPQSIIRLCSKTVSDPISCLTKITHFVFLSDTTRCPMVTSKCAVRHGLIMDRGLWSLFMTHTILCERIEKMKVIEPKRQKCIPKGRAHVSNDACNVTLNSKL